MLQRLKMLIRDLFDLPSVGRGREWNPRGVSRSEVFRRAFQATARSRPIVLPIKGTRGKRLDRAAVSRKNRETLGRYKAVRG